MITSVYDLVETINSFIKEMKEERSSNYRVSDDGNKIACNATNYTIIECDDLKSMGGNSKVDDIMKAGKISNVSVSNKVFKQICSDGTENTFDEFKNLREIDSSDKSLIDKVFKSKTTLKQYEDIIKGHSNSLGGSPLYPNRRYVLIKIGDTYFNVKALYSIYKSIGGTIKEGSNKPEYNGICVENDNVKWFLMPVYIEDRYKGDSLDELWETVVSEFTNTEPTKRRSSNEKFDDEINNTLQKLNKKHTAYKLSDDKLFIPIKEGAAVIFPTEHIKDKMDISNKWWIRKPDSSVDVIENAINNGEEKSIDSSFFANLDKYKKEYVSKLELFGIKGVVPFALGDGFFDIELFKLLYKLNQKDTSGLTFKFAEFSPSNKDVKVCNISGAKNFDAVIVGLRGIEKQQIKDIKNLTKKILGNIFDK